MNLLNIIYDLFVGRPRAYDPKHRQRRLVMLSLFVAIVFAVAFGLALYQLNASGRLTPR